VTKNTKRSFITPLYEFIQDSRAVGVVLIGCTVLSLLISNSAWSSLYTSFWNAELLKTSSTLHFPHTPIHIINDALMAVFFLLAGMEIKRELITGELSSIKRSLLPVIAAAGGMVVPALVFLLWNGGTFLSKGWGIPMATDIAFSLGILSLLGKRVPVSLKIFLMALAIIDDLGGILAIAIFYAGEINTNYLLMAGVVLLVLSILNLLKVQRYYLYFLLGIIMWYFIYNSGVHATVAGVLLAFTLPMKKIGELEHRLHDPVQFIIMPLFALANTAITLPADFGFIFNSPVHHGIFMGLLVGKPLGIVLFSFFAVRIGIAELPGGLQWKDIIGVGLLAGIGFTISIFMATLAYQQLPDVQIISKVAIIGASCISGLAGYIYLRVVTKKRPGMPAASAIE
jgi:Na+:H+ antiporter, NhaA family